MTIKTALARTFYEIGLEAFIHSPYDVKVLCVQRFVRLAAYGASTLVLVLYLVELGNTVTRTGLFMTLTLFGDVVISLMLALIADKLGRRRLLAIGSLLMTASGVVFATASNFWILLLASVVGVISPSGNEVGPFKAIEESTISQLTGADDRSSVLAWYTLHGTAGVAFGTIICGWVVHTLQSKHGWEAVQTYRLVYVAYAVMGVLKFLLCLMLSKACELESPPTPISSEDEQQHLLGNETHRVEGDQADRPSQSVVRKILPSFSTETRSLVLKLGLLFAMDSLGSGLSPPSWIIYYFHTKFELAEEKLGNIFFVTNIVSSASNLVSSSLARHIGLVKTMIFTHAPASIALALLSAPSNLGLAMALLIFRSSTSSMDQAPRQAFLAAAVSPSERTSVMGLMNVVKTLSQSAGPVVTGRLAGADKFWIAFVLAGTLKLLYDALLLGMFLGYRTVEERAKSTVVTGEEQGQGDNAGEQREAT